MENKGGGSGAVNKPKVVLAVVGNIYFEKNLMKMTVKT